MTATSPSTGIIRMNWRPRPSWASRTMLSRPPEVSKQDSGPRNNRHFATAEDIYAEDTSTHDRLPFKGIVAVTAWRPGGFRIVQKACSMMKTWQNGRERVRGGIRASRRWLAAPGCARAGWRSANCSKWSDPISPGGFPPGISRRGSHPGIAIPGLWDGDGGRVEQGAFGVVDDHVERRHDYQGYQRGEDYAEAQR